MFLLCSTPPLTFSSGLVFISSQRSWSEFLGSCFVLLPLSRVLSSPAYHLAPQGGSEIALSVCTEEALRMKASTPPTCAHKNISLCLESLVKRIPCFDSDESSQDQGQRNCGPGFLKLSVGFFPTPLSAACPPSLIPAAW